MSLYDLVIRNGTLVTTDGTRELEDLFGEKILGFPKPTKLVALLLAQSTNATDNNIVLDFFAGSANPPNRFDGHRVC